MIGKNLASWCKLFWKYSERHVTWSPSCQRILGVCGTKAIRPRKSQIHGCKSISLQIFANGNPKVAVLLLLLRLWTPRPPPFWGVLIWLGFLLKHASFVVGNLAHVMQTCNIVQHRATEAHQDMIAWPCSSTVDVSQEDIRAGLQRAEEKSVENGDLIYSFMIVFNERRLSWPSWHKPRKS